MTVAASPAALASPPLLGVLAATLVVLLAWRRRPRTGRSLGLRDRIGTAPSTNAARSRRRVDPLLAVGRPVRRLAHRPADENADREWGLAIIVGLAVALFLHPLWGAAVAAGIVPLSRWRRARRAKVEDGDLADAMPDTVDLLRVAVSAGCTLPVALSAVAPRAPTVIAPALTEAVRRQQRGLRLSEALEVVAGAGEPARPLVRLLVACDVDGAPLEPALDRLAEELRRQRRQRAEVAAKRLPVALLFPLVVFTLPAFALLTVVPLLLATLGSLHR